jgi:hypothetical protein
MLTDDEINIMFDKVASLHPVPVNGGHIVFSTLVGEAGGREFARAIEAAVLAKVKQRPKSFGELHPRNPNSTCECEHWQSCVDCHPTAHQGEPHDPA